MIRRTFVRALSGAILTTLLGIKPWRLEVDDSTWTPKRVEKLWDLPHIRWELIGPDVHEYGEGPVPDVFTGLTSPSTYTLRVSYEYK